MIFGVVLSGGIGRRMGNGDMPKQFLKLGGETIIQRTVSKFGLCGNIDKVVVTAPDGWVGKTQALLGPDVDVVPGGEDRNGSLLNAINHIDEKYGMDEETVVVTHDGARPFVTERVIEENIRVARSGLVADTVVPSTDTIVVSKDGATVSQIPDRSELYRTQTPQSFRALRFRNIYEKLTEEQKSVMTDAMKVFLLAGDEISLIMGEETNIKITYQSDMVIGEALLKEVGE